MIAPINASMRCDLVPCPHRVTTDLFADAALRAFGLFPARRAKPRIKDFAQTPSSPASTA